MLYDKLLKEVRFMWFKKKSKAPIVIDINDINSYIIKNYVPTEEELKPKHTVREQTVDHIVDHTDDHIVDHSQIKYSIRDNVNFSISDERDYSHIQHILSDKKLDDIKKLENIICESFSDALMKHIIQKDVKNSLVYKTAQIDRKLFSKIISVKGYNPSKDTAIALAIALELDLKETNILLSKAGYILSGSRKKDLIIAYFINKKTYDIDTINDALYKLGESTLGRY